MILKNPYNTRSKQSFSSCESIFILQNDTM